MRIALGVEYDGSAFRGWQSQAIGLTVQDTLEAALSAIAAHPLRVQASGRTDTGVHATAQVVHFDTSAMRPDTAWVRGCNALLPPSVAVRWATPVADDFNARFSAHSRSYRYCLYNHPVRPALSATLAGWFHRPLDEVRMQAAATALIGTHDFSAFRSSECQARSPVRTLSGLTLMRQGDWIMFDLTANAFLHHMVRNIIGALVEVGCSRRDPPWVGELLAGQDRRLGAPTFSASGLYLAGVGYDACWHLPASQQGLRLPAIGPGVAPG
ncbi:MAG: tRNA pseudouridine(38-40) synthase TruA [Methyloversatilis sp.]|uniref:tRNA pseudouridine(38-40) synthase TruA n=1 Tax=Methyloversatilis sp. TaxID=2569862 RepID=UPI00273397E8|nr:tRNA pseudouridine(38-40) synthase TruA [Methyloversatilis sp.]MDP3871407.1 tRNA pseudouridine(38-40) synthase TruA [Methyloversatilis sp.]